MTQLKQAKKNLVETIKDVRAYMLVYGETPELQILEENLWMFYHQLDAKVEAIDALVRLVK